jgi:hypothetical protein
MVLSILIVGTLVTVVAAFRVASAEGLLHRAATA